MKTLSMERALDERELLLKALQSAYLKHQKGDESIGWEELGDIMCNALAEVMGDNGFCEWLDEVRK